MPTIIDSLVVELGLDPSKFTRGQRTAAEAFNKTKTEASKSAKTIEESGKKAADALDQLARKALAVFAIFTGARGFKDLVENVNAADAAMGRLSRSMAQTPESLSAVTLAVQRNGGSADEAAQAFQSFSDQIQQLKTTGESSLLPFLVRLQAAGGKQINLNKSLSSTFADLSDDVAALAKRDPALASYLARQIAGPSLGALMMKGGAAFRQAQADSNRHGLITQADTDAALAYQKAWASIQQSVSSYVRELVTAVEPGVVRLLTRLNEWLDANRGWIEGELIPKAQHFLEVVNDMATSFDHAAKRLTGQDGLTVAMEGLAAVLTAKLLGPLATAVRLLTTLGGMSVPAWLLPLLGVAAGASAESTPGAGLSEDATTRAAQTALNRKLTDEANARQGYTGSLFGDTWTYVKRKLGFEATPNGGGASKGRAGAGRASLGRRLGLTGQPPADATPGPSTTDTGGGSHREVVDYIRRSATARGIDPDVALRVGYSEGLTDYDPTRPDRGGDAGTSFGPYQLHYKNNIRGLSLGGLGDDFTRATGLHASDPRTWRQQVDFAMDYASKHGWTPTWHGAIAKHIGRWEGIGQAPPQPPKSGAGESYTNPDGSSTMTNFNPATGTVVAPGSYAHAAASLMQRVSAARRQRADAEERRVERLRMQLNSSQHQSLLSVTRPQLASLSRQSTDQRQIDNSRNIGEVHVHTQATDAASIARDLRPYLELSAEAAHSNYGLA